MKVPTCKLCRKAHWSGEEHDIKESGVPRYVREMAAGALGGNVPRYAAPFVDHLSPQIETTQSYEPPVTVTQDVPTTVSLQGDVPTCECGKPCEGRYKKCAACRKRAYRERSK